jgi:hypothetical protein
MQMQKRSTHGPEMGHTREDFFFFLKKNKDIVFFLIDIIVREMKWTFYIMYVYGSRDALTV